MDGLRKAIKTVVTIDDVPVEIQTKNPVNTSLDCYHYTNLF
jgi:hypothetical protein